MERRPTVLVLDDERRLIDEISEFLLARGYTVLEADRPSAAFKAIDGREVDLALVDIKLPEYDGLEFLRRLREERPLVETIVMSGHGDMESVISAFRLGAFDYLKKPFTPIELQAALSRTTRFLKALGESRRYADLCADLNRELASDGDFIGVSPRIGSVREQIARAAANPDTPVLIRGESGTGKELVARRIHSLSARASGRFIPVNCAAVPREIFESEFFGHVRGAFTDAHERREGLFRSASGGTLFLDEIGEMPLELQAKLLRVLEDGMIRAVGSDRDEPSDTRIVCATNRGLPDLVESGRFRRDLYYRLAVIEVEIAPLRERREDIPVLARYFLEQWKLPPALIAEILDADFVAALEGYDYPGNIRELRNFMERASILRRKPNDDEVSAWFVSRRDTAAARVAGSPEAVPIGPSDTYDLDAVIRGTIRRAMSQERGVRSRAAKLLGISRQALDRRLEKMIDPPTKPIP